MAIATGSGLRPFGGATPRGQPSEVTTESQNCEPIGAN